MSKSYRLLIIDDDLEILRLMESIFSDSPYEVNTFASSLDAIESFKNQCYDIVISDIQMSGMNGLEVLEEVKKKGHFIPFILITAYGEKSVAISAIKQGAFDFVEKPFSKSAIMHSIEKCITFLELQHQNQRLTEENAERKRFDSMNILTSSIVHEITNPLMHILLYVDYLKKEIPIEVFKENPDVVSHLKKIKGSVNHISEIIKNLRMAIADKRKVKFETTSVDSILDQVHELMGVHFRNHQIHYSVEYNDQIQAFNCSRSLIVQVVNNLLSNAVKAIKDEDDRWIKMRVFQEDEKLCFEVIDSGKGIDQETKEKIFDPLFSTHSLSGGLGLGLNISLEIIRLHKGELTIKEDHPHTCFCAKIPLNL